MNHETQIRAAQQHRPTDEGQGSALLRGLFYGVCGVISSGQLRMKPREKMFALLLAERSFGIGQEWGHTDIEGWRHRLEPPWRSNEVKGMLRAFERSLWLVSKKWSPDNAWYALCPLQWPGWAAASARRPRQGRIEFVVPEDLNTILAKISQGQALDPMGKHGGSIEHRISGNGASAASACENFVKPDKPPDSLSKPRIPRRFFAAETEKNTDAVAKISQSRTGYSGTDSSGTSEIKINHRLTDENRLRRQVDETWLVRELGELLGAEEMKANGGNWRVNYVRPHRALMAGLLEELRDKVNDGWTFKTNRAAWLTTAVRNELARKKLTAKNTNHAK